MVSCGLFPHFFPLLNWLGSFVWIVCCMFRLYFLWIIVCYLFVSIVSFLNMVVVISFMWFLELIVLISCALWICPSRWVEENEGDVLVVRM